MSRLISIENAFKTKEKIYTINEIRCKLTRNHIFDASNIIHAMQTMTPDQTMQMDSQIENGCTIVINIRWDNNEYSTQGKLGVLNGLINEALNYNFNQKEDEIQSILTHDEYEALREEHSINYSSFCELLSIDEFNYQILL